MKFGKVMGPEKQFLFLITIKIQTETNGVLQSVLEHVVLVFDREYTAYAVYTSMPVCPGTQLLQHFRL
jgi:hypothetical protein